MAEKETKNNSSFDPDVRYRYIGFNVYGSKVREYFKNDEEKKKYEISVEEYNKTHYAPIRSGTAVRANLLSLQDRIVLTIASLGLVIGSLMTWFKIESIYGTLTTSGILSFTAVSSISDILARFNPMLPNLPYVFSGIAVLSLIFGILSLIAMYLPAKDMEQRAARLKHLLGWQYLPIVLWIGVFIYLTVGLDIPMGDEVANIYMIKGLGSKFNIITFWVMAQPALWLTFAGHIVNAVKSNDL